MLVDKIQVMLDYWKQNENFIHHNKKLFDIYEGDLLTYIIEDLKKDLSPNSFIQIENRIAPINILIKLVDKLSRLYQKPPRRMVYVGEEVSTNSNDQDLLSWYETKMQVNAKFNVWNEFYNTFKNSLVMPFVSNGIPKVRVVPSSQFLPFSSDMVDPLRMTELIVSMGKRKIRGKMQSVFFLYSDEEFLPITENGEIIDEILSEVNNTDGSNPYGKIPAIYINRSQNLLIPKSDTDTFKMTKLLPILLSDINLAIKFQAFSIIYGINVTEENLTMAPNAFWRLKSDADSTAKPELGTIKPSVDISETLKAIQAQLTMWLESKNIRAGSIGQLDVENLASGISKAIDEMDTFEERQKGVEVFKTGEQEFWNLLINHVHPVWVQSGKIQEKRMFTPGAQVDVEFSEQRPLLKFKEILDEVEQEIKLGLTTRKAALKKLHPDMTDAEIDQMLIDIDQENKVEIEMQDNQQQTTGEEDAVGDQTI